MKQKLAAQLANIVPQLYDAGAGQSPPLREATKQITEQYWPNKDQREITFDLGLGHAVILFTAVAMYYAGLATGQPSVQMLLLRQLHPIKWKPYAVEDEPEPTEP